MSVQRSDLYHFSAVDVFLELLKRRISYYTKKVQTGGTESDMVGVRANGKLTLRLIRSKLRKREESSVLRSNAVHPEGVLQATVIGHHGHVEPQHPAETVKSSSPLQDIFVSQLSTNTTVSTLTVTTSASETSLSSCETDWSSPPLFLYSPATSRNSLNTNDQGILIHPSGPAEDLDAKSKRNIRGKLKKLVKRKPPNENYTIPVEFQEQLKQIYVY